MWLSNEPVIIWYMQVARFVSVLFLSYQAIIMLVLAIKVNDFIV